ncbi:MAG: PAS domain S-box protein [Ignavibacteriaceae bacterium]
MESLKNKIPAIYLNPASIAVSILIYLLWGKLFFNVFNETTFFFALAPIIFAGWISGERTGVLTAFLLLILNHLFFPFPVDGNTGKFISLLPFSVAAIGAGWISGKFGERYKRSQADLNELNNEHADLKNQMFEQTLKEEELKRNSERGNLMMENISEVIFQIDSDNELTYLNPAWKKLTGFSIPESLGNPLGNYFHPEESEKVRQFFSHIKNKDQKETKLIVRFLTQQNIYKWVEINCKKMLDPQERTIGVFGTLKDYSEIKQTEENLKSNARFEKLIATISTAFINIPLSKIDQGITAALKVIGMFFNVDRSYLFLCSETEHTYVKTHEWIGNGVNRSIIKSQKMGSQSLSYFEEKLTSFETIYIHDVAQLSAETALLKKILQRSQIKSIVILPLIYSNELIGFLGFDAIQNTREFSKESLQLLKVIADIFANAYQNKKREEKIVSLNQELESRVTQRTIQLERANEELTSEIIEKTKVQSALEESEIRYRTLFESNPYPMWVYDCETFHFLTVNDMAIKNYGYSLDEFLNKTIQEIHPEEEIPSTLEYLSTPLPTIHRAGTWRHVKKDGTVIDVEIISHSITFGEKEARLVLALDVTERTKAEKQLQDSLAEKEIMIKEIHHRVKNNLQIISSLLTLQAEYIKDESARGYFNDSQNRVKSMAIIHEKLYQTRDFAKIDIKDYVSNLTLSLFKAYNINTNLVDIDVDISNISLDVDTAIPCGLIINELVSNSLKYAFSDGRKGKMVIKLLPVGEDKLQLTVSDNGLGLPVDLETKEAKSLGLTLVHILAKQLNGNVEVISKDGATFIVTFLKPFMAKN